MSGHAPPFFCPYCGEEDIRPFGEQHGDWRCAACLRLWRLRYLGTARRAESEPDRQAVSGAGGGLEPA